MPLKKKNRRHVVDPRVYLLTVCSDSVSVYFDSSGVSTRARQQRKTCRLLIPKFSSICKWFSLHLPQQHRDKEHGHLRLNIRRAPPVWRFIDQRVLSFRFKADIAYPSRQGWRVLQHFTKYLSQIIKTPQVPVLSVSLCPGCAVVQGLRWWQLDCFTEVDHPDSGLAGGIMHKEQRTPNRLEIKRRISSNERDTLSLREMNSKDVLVQARKETTPHLMRLEEVWCFQNAA